MRRKIAVYTRVSTRDQVTNGYGLSAQKTMIDEYLKDHNYDLSNVSYYVDEGISGKDLNREAISELLKDVVNKKIEKVVILKLDRLTRSVSDMYNIINIFLENNTSLVSVIGNIDINCANGRFMIGMLSIMGQWEREIISERTNDGLLEKALKGEYPKGGSTPFGYNRDENDYLSINESEANVVKKAYELAARGFKQSEIHSELSSYDCYKKKYSTSIRNLITNPIYKGIVEFKGEVFDNIAPAIVSSKLWEEANVVLSKRYRISSDSGFLFDKIVYCASHKKLLDRSYTMKHIKNSDKVKKYYYYICDECKKRVNQDRIINDMMISMLFNVKKIRMNNSLARIAKRRKSLMIKREFLLEQYINDCIDKDSYINSQSKITKELESLEENVEIIKGRKIEEFNKLSNKEKKIFIKTYVKKIVYDFDNEIVVKIEYNKEVDDFVTFLS